MDAPSKPGSGHRDHRLTFRPDIQGLRALAILLVVAAHARLTGFAGGFVGVDVFFVLSGYLITALIVEELRTTGQVRFARFYVRRLRRLMPGLLLMLAGTGLLAWLLLPTMDQSRQAESAINAAGWISNIYFAMLRVGYFDPDAASNLFLHTWSLGVEEQFYLLSDDQRGPRTPNPSLPARASFLFVHSTRRKRQLELPPAVSRKTLTHSADHRTAAGHSQTKISLH